jgi:hypothetical protein
MRDDRSVAPVRQPCEPGNRGDDRVSFSYDDPATAFVKYEIEIRSSNNDKIQAQFKNKADAVKFLRGYEDPFKPAT